MSLAPATPDPAKSLRERLDEVTKRQLDGAPREAHEHQAKVAEAVRGFAETVKTKTGKGLRPAIKKDE